MYQPNPLNPSLDLTEYVWDQGSVRLPRYINTWFRARRVAFALLTEGVRRAFLTSPSPGSGLELITAMLRPTTDGPQIVSYSKPRTIRLRRLRCPFCTNPTSYSTVSF